MRPDKELPRVTLALAGSARVASGPARSATQREATAKQSPCRKFLKERFNLTKYVAAGLQRRVSFRERFFI